MLGNARANQQVAFARAAVRPHVVGLTRIGDRRSCTPNISEILGGQAILVVPVAHHEEPARRSLFETVASAGCRSSLLAPECMHMSGKRFTVHVAAFGTQGHLDRVGQDVDALQHLLPGFAIELDLFGRHVMSPMFFCEQ